MFSEAQIEEMKSISIREIGLNSGTLNAFANASFDYLKRSHPDEMDYKKLPDRIETVYDVFIVNKLNELLRIKMFGEKGLAQINCFFESKFGSPLTYSKIKNRPKCECCGRFKE